MSVIPVLPESEQRVFELSEYESKDFSGIPSEIATKIQDSGIVDISRNLIGDEFTLRAGSRVGFISVGQVQINVRPRFPVYNIFYFLGLVKELKLEDEKVQINDNHDFLTILFQAFLDSVNSATIKGLLSGYRRKEESTPVLRGRINFADQYKSHPGTFYPFEVIYDEFTEDIAENRIIKKALEISLRFGIQSQKLRDNSLRKLLMFREVTSNSEENRWTKSRLNQHYWDALKLAELIISGDGFDSRFGNTAIRGFSIDMYRVFEEFIANQFKSKINNAHNEVLTQEKLNFDTEGVYKEIPDIVWYREGKPFQVFDTKYKDPGTNSGQRDSLDDLRQVKNYASTLKLKSAHIIYGVADEIRKIPTSEGGITIYTHGIDLSVPPALIAQQLDALVNELIS